MCKKTLLASYVIMLLSILCVSCESIYDGKPCQSERSYTLNLNIATDHLFTRASVHDETEKGSDDERFINVEGKDYSIFILDANGRLVWRFEPDTPPTLTSEGYQLSGSFTAQNDLEKIRVLVMANWTTSGFNGKYPSIPDMDLVTLNTLYTDANRFNFTLPTPPQSDGKNGSWVPSAAQKQGIPMFGLSKEISIADSKNINVQNVDMLRSVAKIEIVNITPPEDKAEIVACRLTTYNTTGRLVPDATLDGNEKWATEGVQVTVPSLPAVETTSTDLSFAKSQDGKTFTVYIPEMALSDEEGRPVVEVDVSVNGSLSTGHIIELASYQNGKPSVNLESLLRNHNYRFNIKQVGISADFTIYIETPEWDTEEDVWVYEDAKAVFDEDFTWTEANYDSSDIAQRTLIVTPHQFAKGSFSLSAPARGTWTLSLFADDQTENDAFRIDLWDDTAQDWITGSDTVTGNIENPAATVTFRVIATAVNNSETLNSARLVMTVKTFDDRIAQVNLTAAGSASEGYYVIKQEPTGFYSND